MKTATKEEEERLSELSRQGTTPAPPGQIWLCQACGKTSRTKYGFNRQGERKDEAGERYADHGWDESCMLNSVLVHKDSIRKDHETRTIHAVPVEPN